MKQKKYNIIIGDGKKINRFSCKENLLQETVKKFIEDGKQLMFITLAPRQ